MINAITEYAKICNENFFSFMKISLINPKKKASTLKPATNMLKEAIISLIIYEFNAITQVPNPISRSNTIVIIPPITYFNPALPLVVIICTIPIIMATNADSNNPTAIVKSASINLPV